MNKFLSFALKTAKTAGAEILKNSQKPHDVTYKSVKNPVTKIDRKIDAMITKKIARAYPSHAILSEELASNLRGNPKFLWVVDPIDGTLNFMHRMPFVAVSIALVINGKIALGVVYNPILNELFYAEKNSGAYLNNKKITVSRTQNISQALLATGMQPVFGKKEIVCYENFCRAANAIRRLGSASIDLSYIACGKLDGCFEIGLKPWDIAAGILILEEAGGRVSGFDKQPLDFLRNGNIIASNKKIHQQMLYAASPHNNSRANAAQSKRRA